MLEITQIPVLQDNYSYLLVDSETGESAVIDPSEPRPIFELLKKRGIRPDFVLNTHHHWDHTGANLALQQEFGAQVVGPQPDQNRIPGFTRGISDGEPFRLGRSELIALYVPGHTMGHTAYYSAEAEALFCGDTLFTLGCGFLFEGTPQLMWASLEKLRLLPGATRVFCGHEYTLESAEFALHFDGENRALQEYVARARQLAAAGKPTVPSTMAEERAANPFLRSDDPAIKQKLGLAGAEDWRAFGEIRRLKNEFDDAKKAAQ